MLNYSALFMVISTKLYKKLCGSRPSEEVRESEIVSLTPENYRSLRSKINKNIAKNSSPM